MSLRPSVEWLLVLFPVAVVLKRVGAPAPLIFVVAALVIVPLAALIVRSTEQVAERTGPALFGTLIVVTTSGDGQATWFKGVQLLAVYFIIAASVYWLPVVSP